MKNKTTKELLVMCIWGTEHPDVFDIVQELGKRNVSFKSLADEVYNMMIELIDEAIL